MSEHKAEIKWNRGGVPFEFREYPRNHTWNFENGVVIEGSAAPAYLGDGSKIDPEEAFVASLSSCHMLTFLAICAKKKLTVETYTDSAVGFLDQTGPGKMAITRVELHPEVEFADGVTVSREDLEDIHDKAHHACFIANSVTSEIITVIQ